MLNTVKELLYTVGDNTGSFAKHIGLSSVDMARTVGGRGYDVARTVGERSVEIARDIGPKRALVGAAILAVAVGGGIILVRYLRRREQERMDAESMEGGFERGEGRDSKMSRRERRAVNTATSMPR